MAGSMSGVIAERNGRDIDLRFIRGIPLRFDIVLTFEGIAPESWDGWYAEMVATAHNGARWLNLSTDNGKAALLQSGRIRFSEAAGVMDKAQSGSYRVRIMKPDGTGGQLLSGKAVAIGDSYR